MKRDVEQENRAWLHRQREIQLASDGLREQELHRIAAHYELESDEFYTWREKAERIRKILAHYPELLNS
jgi:abortive infection bacteriophage resistance protein